MEESSKRSLDLLSTSRPRQPGGDLKCYSHGTPSCAARLGSIVALFILGAGCSSEWLGEADSIVRFTADTLASFELQGREFEAADSLAIPYALIVRQNYVLVGDVGGGSPLIVFDRLQGGFVASGGRFGQAPGELTGLRDIIPVAEQGAGWVFDFAGRSIQYVDVESFVLTRTLPDRRVLLNEGPGDPYSPVWISDSTIISSGTYGSERFAVFSASGTFLHTAGPAPPGDEMLPQQVRHRVYSVVLRSNPSDQRIAAVYDRSDRLDIFEGTELQHVVRGPDFFEPLFTVRTYPSGVVRPDYSDEYRYGYEDLTVTDRTIFALYSGKTLTESPTGEDSGSHIITFSWDGQPLAVLHVGDAPQRIAVSEDGRDLYVAYWLPSPLIKRFQVPESLW